MVESNINQENAQPLTYFDPDLFEPSSECSKDRFLELYECAICSGVVIKPLECSTSTCAMLYCEKCIGALKDDKQCPRRCGSNTFHQPNKHIMRQLHELKFKCLNHPKCPEIVPYHTYEKHVSECKVGNQPCQNPKCTALQMLLIKQHNEEKEKLLQQIEILESMLAQKESEGPQGDGSDKVSCSKGHSLIQANHAIQGCELCDQPDDACFECTPCDIAICTTCYVMRLTDEDAGPIVKKGEQKESSEEDDENSNDGEDQGNLYNNRGGFGGRGSRGNQIDIMNQGFRGSRGVPRGGYRGHVEQEGLFFGRGGYGYIDRGDAEGGYRGRGDGEGGYRGRGDFQGYRGRGDAEGGYRGRGDNEGGYRGRGDFQGYRGRGDNDGGYRGRGDFQVNRGRGDAEGGYRGRGDAEGGYRGRVDFQDYRGRGGDAEGGYRGRGDSEGGYRGRVDAERDQRGRGGFNVARGGQRGRGGLHVADQDDKKEQKLDSEPEDKEEKKKDSGYSVNIPHSAQSPLPSLDPLIAAYNQKGFGYLPAVVLENPNYKAMVGEFIYEIVEKFVGDERAPRITGMLIDLPLNDIRGYLYDFSKLYQKIGEALNLYNLLQKEQK